MTSSTLKSVNVAFHSPKRSIARARKHINDLELAIRMFNNDGSALRFVKEHYRNGSKYVVKAKLRKRIPDEFESIAIDAIYNLRSSLDQAVYSVASIAKVSVGNGSGIDLSKRVWKFPIEKHKWKVEKWISETLCKPAGFPDQIGTDIKSFKPYFNGRADDSVIYGLNKAANVNKHRFLTPADVRFGHYELRHVSGPKIGNFDTFVIGHGHGGLTGSLVTDLDAPVGQDEIGFYTGYTVSQSDYNVKGTVDIMFSNIPGLESRSCVFQLRGIADICERVVNRFGATCASLGFCH